MKTVKYILIIILSFEFSVGFSQNIKDFVSIPSPNSASIAKYVETQVSLSSGTPNISLPLYQIKDGSLSLPITLSYDASGVRPDVHPGWTGQNWTLNCGGLITRIVKGMPDELAWQDTLSLSTQQTFPQNFAPGYFFNLEKLNNDLTWDSEQNILKLAKIKDATWTEAEPDEFIFNLSSGISGKFYIDHTGHFKVVSEVAVKVEIFTRLIQCPGYLTSPYLSNVDAFNNHKEMKIHGFRITIPNGDKYEFGNWASVFTGEDAFFEASIDFFQEGYFLENWDSWYLARVESANGTDEIKFSYEMGDPIASFGHNVAMDKKSGSNEPKGIFRIFGPITAKSFEVTQRYNGKIIYPVYLKSVESKNCLIEFDISHTTELRYDYNSIFSDLVNQADNTYSTKLYSYSPRNTISAHVADRGKEGVASFLRKDMQVLNKETGDVIVTGNVINYINSLIGDQYSGFWTFNNGLHIYEAIDFNRLKWYKLDKIRIKDKVYNKPLKSFNFRYNNSINERLMLMSFYEEGQNGEVIPPYEFEYENYNSEYYPGTTKLPPYNSYKVDHWGFFNNINSLEGLDFKNEATLTAYHTKRNSVDEHLYCGILNKLKFPEGGYTRYVYQPNEYKFTVVRNDTTGRFTIREEETIKKTGGLRIKEIRTAPGAGKQEIIKSYEYYGGTLNGESQYFWKNYKGKFVEGDGTYTSDRFITNTILPVSVNSAGGHISYSKVIESAIGNGHTEFYFSNHNDYPDLKYNWTIDVKKSPYAAFTSRELMRGRLTKRLVYDEYNRLTMEELNEYGLNPYLKNSFVRAVENRQIEVLDGVTIEGSSYKANLCPFNLVKKEIREYDNDGKYFSTVSEMKYNENNFLYLTKSTDSNGDSLISKLSYPSDYSISDEANPLNKMRVRNILDPVIEELNLRNGKLIGGKITAYGDYSDKLLPKTVYGIEIKYPKEFNYLGLYRSNPETGEDDFKRKLSFTSYTGDKLSSYFKEGDVIQSIIWGYNNSMPIAEITNAAYNDVAYTSFESEDDGNWNAHTPNDTTARTGAKSYKGKLTKAGLSSDKEYFISLWAKNAVPTLSSGILSPIDTIGDWTYYEGKVTSITTIDVESNNGLIDEVRLHPVNARMKTYTFSPLKGITSNTDENGNTTFYRYDSLNRLQLILDNELNILKAARYNYKQ